jgi:hypothetical protein
VLAQVPSLARRVEMSWESLSLTGLACSLICSLDSGGVQYGPP